MGVRTGRWVVAAAIAGMLALAVPITAHAATPPVGVFPAWSATPAGFDAVFSPESGMPTARVTTTGSAPSVAKGSAAYLGASTAFGQRFGTSRAQPYLTVGLNGLSASVTTVTFDAPTAPGWGFALGDVDADLVSIVATGPGGTLTSAQLGAQTTVDANYCFGASPKPTTCGTTPTNDVPTWCPAGSADPVCVGRPADSLVGSGTDTSGAYGWFTPTVPVSSLQLTFDSQLGLPSFQLWLVALSQASTVTGEVSLGGTGDDPIPAGTSLALLDDAGVPVTDILDEPVFIPLPPTGDFSFETAYGDYQLDLVAPPGVVVDPALFPVPFSADADVTALGTILAAALDPAAADPLVPTGVDSAVPLAAASVLLVGGAVLLLAARRPRSL